LALLQEARAAKPSDRQRIDFIMMMMRGKKVGFEKVFKMIDNMVELLKKEQGEDDEKREYCKAAFDEAEDKIKVPTRREGQLETQIAEAKENIVTFKEEIKALGESIKDLDKTVKDATEQREEENSDHKTLMINDQAAKELLVFAKNRLNKFYNPKLYVPESFVQISMHNNEAPPPPPEGPSAYKKNSEGGNSVVAMIDSLVKDLDMEMSESETNERLAQENYEEMMQDSKEKRQADTKSLTEKSEALADTEDTLNAKSDELTSTQKEIMAAHEYMGQLHGECDWLMKFYDVRKKARDSELQTLSKAKAILNGADFSLVQVKSRRFLHHQ
jgi:septal ring factor EnvC (AmiA/AmiB activator)